MILTINGKQAALKKGSSIEYVSENRIFTDADDYSMEIELPLADCPQNLDIFANTLEVDRNSRDWESLSENRTILSDCPRMVHDAGALPPSLVPHRKNSIIL